MQQGAVRAFLRARHLGGSHIGAGHSARLTEAGAMDVFADMRELPSLIAIAEQDAGDLRRSA